MSPFLVDWNGDGLIDLLVGTGTILFYLNTGSNKNDPIFTRQNDTNNPFKDIPADSISSPALGDLNNDGRLDLIIGTWAGTIQYYSNNGTGFVAKNSPTDPFYLVTSNSASLTEGVAKPSLVDMNDDGKLDLVCGGRNGKIQYYKNIGTKTDAKFEHQSGSDNPFNDIFVFPSSPTLGDLNADGIMELIVGEYNGKLLFYSSSRCSPNPTCNSRGTCVFSSFSSSSCQNCANSAGSQWYV